MNYEPLTRNPLRTRGELFTAVRDLWLPVRRRFSEGKARVRLAVNTAVYSDVTAEFEAFARPLWGIAPLVVQSDIADNVDIAQIYVTGIVNGTDPSHPEYWGELADFDQAIVETAALACALCFAPAQLWTPLPSVTKSRLSQWLRSPNALRLYANNWLFFRVMNNLALQNLGEEYDNECLESDLRHLESFYLGDGWYSDGDPRRCDYYSAFGMQFYSLLYASLAFSTDPERCERFKCRAVEFAGQFMHFFSSDGSALPFGRSLTYRFAQSAFWSALAFSGAEVNLGVLKGLLLRNLRWWLRQPIFTETGLLTIGYSYPNAAIADHYNGPGSPYWAMKAFVCLLLPPSHPFWSCEEAPLPNMPEKALLPQARMVVCRSGQHVQLFGGADLVNPGLRHGAPKYNKFVYSNRFGFNVPTANLAIESSVHDSMLSVSTDGVCFTVRSTVDMVHISTEALVCCWSPLPQVRIVSWVVPVLTGHMRIHLIHADCWFEAREGGFPVACDGRTQFEVEPHSACARGTAVFSVIWDLLAMRRGGVVAAHPSSNVYYVRTAIPFLTSRLPAGEHLLACAVHGSDDPSCHSRLQKIHFYADGEAIEIRDEEGNVHFRDEISSLRSLVASRRGMEDERLWTT